MIATSEDTIMATMKECIAKVLTDKEGRMILELLKNKEMPFTKIQMYLEKEFGRTVHNQSLTRILHELDKYGLIYQKLTRKSPKYYSYYELSPLGRDILNYVRKIEKTLQITAS